MPGDTPPSRPHHPPADREAELRRAVDEERERVAREIHDELAQELFALRLLAESVAAGTGPDLPARARRVAELAAQAEHTVRALSRRYSPPEAPCDFESAVRELASRHSAEVAFHLALPPGRVARWAGHHLHRIVQEAVTNAVRHGGATTIAVALDCDRPNWLLRVGDDGRGFDPASCEPGLGLRNMRFRANQLGGHFQIGSSALGGAEVLCEFPAAPEGAQSAGPPALIGRDAAGQPFPPASG